jgi:hypothetical protein
MARIDKIIPGCGGFRAPLYADYTGATAAVGVGIDATGKVVLGGGVTGIIGVICLPKDKKAGDMVDVMKAGELVNFGGAAGTIYTANTTTGAITSAAASATQTKVGFTLDADRLIVDVSADRGFDAT